MNKAKKQYVSKRCPKCGKVFLFGVNGTVDGCDKCTHYRRDGAGNYHEHGSSMNVKKKAHK